MIVAIAISVLVGAFAQRTTGMGFALVASPALVLLLGPFDGVIIVNLCAVLSAAIILPRVWRGVDWRRFRWLVVPAVVGTMVGAGIAARAPSAWLQMAVGALVVVALTVTLLFTRTKHTATGPAPAIGAGFASGVMNAAAGVGGPALSMYAVANRWPQTSFAATAQPYFIVISTASLIGKLSVTNWQIPALEPTAWLWIVAALLTGLALGEWLHSRIEPRVARIAVVTIAYVGGVVALVDGARTLVEAL
ncbi:MAG: sulfite exporter TauE/SafE family protein [Rhodoglobus sp.]